MCSNIHGRKGTKAAEMKEYLDKGLYVICNVGGHWVYVDGIIGDDVYMADPAKDEIMMFKAYNNASITCFQALKGKNPYSGFTPLTIKEEVSETSSTTALSSTTTTATATVTTAKAAASSSKTTTATKAAVTSKATSVSAVKNSAAVSTAKTAPNEYMAGEYYCTAAEKVDVFADMKDQKTSIAALEYGNIVNVVSVSGSYGEVKIGGKKGFRKAI